MDRQPVKSSNLNSVGYDLATNILEIQFNSGGVYQYFSVPNSVYLELMRATSKGNYFHRNIKGHYKFERIR
jgi:hypothetical protein